MSSLVNKAKGFVAEKVAHVPKPEATVKDVDIKGVSRDGAKFNAEVSVNNPYSSRLPICEIHYTLKSAGRVVASGTVPDPGWIEASGETKLNVPVKVPYDFLISITKDAGNDWDIDYELELKLIIDLPVVGKFTIPLSQKGEQKLPTLSDMF